MAEQKAPTFAEAAAAARAKRKKREAEKAAEKARAEAPESVDAPTTSTGLIDRIRKAFSSEDDIARIDAAVEAVESGVAEADADAEAKRKK